MFEKSGFLITSLLGWSNFTPGWNTFLSPKMPIRSSFPLPSVLTPALLPRGYSCYLFAVGNPSLMLLVRWLLTWVNGDHAISVDCWQGSYCHSLWDLPKDFLFPERLGKVRLPRGACAQERGRQVQHSQQGH